MFQTGDDHENESARQKYGGISESFKRYLKDKCPEVVINPDNLPPVGSSMREFIERHLPNDHWLKPDKMKETLGNGFSKAKETLGKPGARLGKGLNKVKKHVKSSKIGEFIGENIKGKTNAAPELDFSELWRKGEVISKDEFNNLIFEPIQKSPIGALSRFSTKRILKNVIRKFYKQGENFPLHRYLRYKPLEFVIAYVAVPTFTIVGINMVLKGIKLISKYDVFTNKWSRKPGRIKRAELMEIGGFIGIGVSSIHIGMSIFTYYMFRNLRILP